MQLASLFRRRNGSVTLRASAVDPVYAIRVLSDVLDRVGFARAGGKTYGGKRDFYEALGYARALRVEDFRDRYERGDVAGRIVDTYPKETWQDGPELIEDEDPEVI